MSTCPIFLWLIPVLAGWFCDSHFDSVSSTKGLARPETQFSRPRRIQAPRVVELLHENLARAQDEGGQNEGELNVADPGAYSLHLALLPNRPVKKRQRHQLRALVYQLVEDGPETLSATDKRALIADPETLARLHTLAWSRRTRMFRPSR